MVKSLTRHMTALAIAVLVFSGSFLNVTQVSHAAPGNTTVYLTKTGSCYHADGCASLKKSKIQTTLSDAVANGYTPCSKCHPGTLDADATDNSVPTATTTNSSVSNTTAPSATTVSNDPTVYLTKTGKCYHVDGCSSLSKSKIATTLSKAIDQGYKACSKCKSGKLKVGTDTSSDKKADTKEVEALKNYAGNTSEFNAYNYYKNNADLQTAIGPNGDALLKHYNDYGKAEGRSGK